MLIDEKALIDIPNLHCANCKSVIAWNWTTQVRSSDGMLIKSYPHTVLRECKYMGKVFTAILPFVRAEITEDVPSPDNQ